MDEFAAQPLTQLTRPAMATEWEILLPYPAPPAWTDAVAVALEQIGHWESRLSSYLPNSELSRINRSAYEQAIKLDGELWQLFDEALQAWRITEGAYDLTAGPLIDAWGIAKRAQRRPPDSELADLRERVGSQHLLLDPAAHTIRFARPGIQLNPGGIGKGFALDRAARSLKLAPVTDFLFHGGQSSVLARGRQQAQWRGWQIALRHPRDERRRLGSIMLCDSALATSGCGRQFFHLDGQRHGHVLDPRTAWPAETDLMSLTVICRSAAMADALATGLFVLGLDRASQIAARLSPPLGLIAVTAGGREGDVRLHVQDLPAGCSFQSNDVSET